jgi:hypothetical protein
MASIKDVMYSINGEPLLKQKLGKDFAGLVTYKKDAKGKVIYPTDKDWYLFKLVDSNKKGGVRLSNIDDVKNPVTGKVERIRLLSGIDSIWQKDQKDITKDYVQANWIELRFFRNQKMMRVSKDNPQVLEFLRITNSNIGNPDRVKGSRHEFFEYDSALADSEAYELENFELEMALEAKSMKPDMMRKHAAFLGIALTNSLGEQKSDDGVRKDYVMYAKRNPAYFKQTMADKTVELSWLVRKAISEGLVDVGRERGKVFWSKSGGMIGVYPQNQNAQDYLTDLANTNTEDGQRFKEQLKQFVK